MHIRFHKMVFLLLAVAVLFVLLLCGSALATTRGQFYAAASSTYSGCSAYIDTPPSMPSTNVATIKSCVEGKAQLSSSMQSGWKYYPGYSYPRNYVNWYNSGYQAWQEDYVSDASWNNYPGIQYGITWVDSWNLYAVNIDWNGEAFCNPSGLSTDWQTQTWYAGLRQSNSSDRSYSDIGFGNSSNAFRILRHSDGTWVNSSSSYRLQDYGIANPFNLYPYYAFTWKTTSW